MYADRLEASILDSAFITWPKVVASASAVSAQLGDLLHSPAWRQAGFVTTPSSVVFMLSFSTGNGRRLHSPWEWAVNISARLAPFS
jgi:hypothetical protein